MPVAPLTVNRSKLLLGEGADEVRFFNALLKHLGITDVQVVDYGGKTKLTAFLRTLATPLPGFAAVTTLAVTATPTPTVPAPSRAYATGFRPPAWPCLP